MADDIITNLELIEELARRREDANWRFRSYVKGWLRWSDEDLDARVHRTAAEVAAQIECTQCANCCKQLEPAVDAEDIDRLAGRLGITARQFREQYVHKDEWGDECLKALPCPFLTDNRCSVYEDRPTACRDFPYLQMDGFRERTIMAVQNCSLCPIVFNTVEDLKRSTGFLTRQRRRR